MLRILALSLLLSPAAIAAPPGVPMPLPPLTTLAGDPLSDATLAGKVVLFVNVASRCGYTRQYDGLQKLWAELKDRGFVIVGVPCNQFGGQEPGSAQEIQSFCKLNYGVDFPLLEKQDVNGPNRSALYQRLVSSPAGDNKDVRWNFEKFLVGRDGAVIARFPSSVTPDSPELRAAIDVALAAK